MLRICFYLKNKGTNCPPFAGIFISIFVILVVVGLVAATVVLVTPPKGPPR
jgi:hypothetical protein